MDQLLLLKIIPVTCNKVQHQGEEVKALCLRAACDKTSGQCFKCVQELHQDCQKSMKMCKDIPHLVSPLQLFKIKLIELKLNMNLKMSKLIKWIEETLKPISDYSENPNLTNLNKLGAFLKLETESNMKKQLENLEEEIISLFEQYKKNVFKSPPIQKPYEILEKDKQVLNESKAEEALTMVEAALQQNQNNKALLLKKGQILYQLRRYQNAIECYDLAIKIDRSYSLAWQNMGKSLWQLDRNEEAVTCFNQAIKIDPNNTWNDKRKTQLKQLGQQISDQNRYQEQLSSFNQVTKYPNYIQAWNNKGISQLKFQGYSLNQLKKYHEAIQYLDQGIQMNPNNANCYKNKGYSLIGLKRYEEAIQYFQYALKIKPNLERAITGLNIAKEELKKLRK